MAASGAPSARGPEYGLETTWIGFNLGAQPPRPKFHKLRQNQADNGAFKSSQTSQGPPYKACLNVGGLFINQLVLKQSQFLQHSGQKQSLNETFLQIVKRRILWELSNTHFLRAVRMERHTSVDDERRPESVVQQILESYDKALKLRSGSYVQFSVTLT